MTPPFNEQPRRKQRGIKTNSQLQGSSPQGAGNITLRDLRKKSPIMAQYGLRL
ncbi:hypothetical protein [Xenorhabdus bovienii]|uniref:hypothetical protein n=1 Tax=Xenorhabdus bovienii TaxID=40576 RepID=UPI000A52E41A|nr:hypothetical protein [Xenorhabdus bovienii]